MQPTPVFLPGESQGQGSLVGFCLLGHAESDTTEATQQQQQQLGNIEQEEKGTTEKEMVGWHHQLYGHEFGLKTLDVGDGQGSLAYCGLPVTKS